MEAFDLVIIGAGPAGEAAAYAGAELGAAVAVIEHQLFGGECPFWACMPSKTLLSAAARRACDSSYPWQRASDRRDWMISREGTDYPSDAGHVRNLEAAGCRAIRGTARVVASGRVEVRTNGSPPETIEGRSIIVSAGSTPFIPPIEGLADAGFWTNREATSLRHLPSSIVVLGGGPVGVELAQVYTRFGAKTTLVEGSDRLIQRDHPLSSRAVAEQLAQEGVEIRTGVTATAVSAGGPGRVVALSDGTRVEAAELLVSVGRRPADLRALGLEEAGVELSERGTAAVDDQLRAGPGLFLAGDAAGGLMFTHVADYEGTIAARAAMGREVRADLLAVPKSTFTDPELGAVGMTVEEAQAAGVDAVEFSKDFAKSGKGQTIEGARGHLTIVVDRAQKILIGAFAACPSGGELIHEAVLAIKQRVPIAVLADTIHAFPTAARVMAGLYQQAARELG